MGERYWEVDAIRGLALAGMIIYHTFASMIMFHMIVEDDHFLKYYNTIYIATSTFILIAGVALILRHERVMAKGQTNRDYYYSIVRRAMQLIILALIITVASFIGARLFMGSEAFIKFGFLHMIGVSMLLAIPFLRFGRWNFIPGFLIVIIGVFIIPHIQSPEWLFPLGIHGPNFMELTQDYFPLFPWFGVLLVGIALGTILYPEGKRRVSIPDPGPIGKFFAKIGHGNVTLLVYMIHIPIIFAILWVVSAVTGIGYLGPPPPPPIP